MRKFSLSLGAVLLMTLMLTSVIQPAALLEFGNPEDTILSQDSTPGRILFDESHVANSSDLWAPGNASLLSWMLGLHGYNSSTNFYEALDSGILDDYDILVIFFPQIALTAGEISAIHTFVDDGGGLLLVGVDNVNTGYGFTAQLLNPISATYGIEFNEDKLTKIYDQDTFIDHHLGQPLIRLPSRGEKMDSCSLTVTGSAISVSSDAEGVLVAVAESGLGRVVAVGGPGPFYMYNREDSRTWDYENILYQFGLNVMDWLMSNDYREVSYPDIAEITVGNGPNLSPAELEQYTLYVGSTHVHTTHSNDGVSTPLEQLEKGFLNGLEFLGFADHSHDVDVPIQGITGGLEAEEIIQQYSFNLEAFIGAELSSVIHTVGIGMTENVITGDLQTAVDELHTQGALAILAHPVYGAPYGQVFADRHIYGYDGIEIASAGFFYGDGEAGFTDLFYTGSDAHETDTLLRTLTGIFVDEPSGPNGMLTLSDIQEAILDRRILVLDRVNDFVYGEKIWVDRFMDIWDLAEDEVSAARALVDDMVEEGHNITLSELYLAQAERALDAWSICQARCLAANATSDLALGIDFDIPVGTLAEPDADFALAIPMRNNHTFGISLNGTIYEMGSMDPDSVSEIFESPAQGVGGATWNVHTNPTGLIPFKMNLHSFNTTDYLLPLFIKSGTAIDNVTIAVTPNGGGYDIEIRFHAQYPSSLEFSSGKIYYNDGTDDIMEEMERERNYWVGYLNNIPANTNITFHIGLTTFDGESFTLRERLASTPGTGPFVIPDLLLIGVLGGGIAAVAVIIVLMKRQK